eukprot:7904577-Lingulodinium_polyedra.AAC.1
MARLVQKGGAYQDKPRAPPMPCNEARPPEPSGSAPSCRGRVGAPGQAQVAPAGPSQPPVLHPRPRPASKRVAQVPIIKLRSVAARLPGDRPP